MALVAACGDGTERSDTPEIRWSGSLQRAHWPDGAFVVDVAFSHGRFVAVGGSGGGDERAHDGLVLTSEDGHSWQILSVPNIGIVWSVAGDEHGRWVALAWDMWWVSGRGMVTAERFLRSEDGVHWDDGRLRIRDADRERSYPRGYLGLTDLTYGAGVFVAVGDGGDGGSSVLLRSADGGRSWQRQNFSHHAWWAPEVVFSGEQFLVYGAGSSIAWSEQTGTHWRVADLGVIGTSHLAWHDETLFGLAVNDCCAEETPDGRGRRVLAGSDQMHLEQRAWNGPMFRKVVTHGGTHVAISDAGIHMATGSIAGATWHPCLSGRFYSIAFGDGVWIAVGAEGIYRSADAREWVWVEGEGSL